MPERLSEAIGTEESGDDGTSFSALHAFGTPIDIRKPQPQGFSRRRLQAH
jgi:hypothetical protein